METKKWHLYDYLILLIIVALFLGTFIGYTLKPKENMNNIGILNEIEKSKENEKFLNSIIKNQFDSILKINIINDSLEKENINIDIKRKINYNNYQNEIKRNNKINNISDAGVIMDSILWSKGIK